MKISKKTRNNFEFYLCVSRNMQLIGDKPQIIEDINGYSAIEAFNMKDSRGTDVPCREIEILTNVLWAKNFINLQIKMWAEGIADFLFIIDEFKRDFSWFPNWVWIAVEQQSVKILKNKLPTRETGILCFECGQRSGIDCPGRKPCESTRCLVCLDKFMSRYDTPD